MSRRKNSLNNTAIALFSEIVVALVGFFLPNAIIVNYGSEANGLITSLQQLIQYFTLIEAGLSGAAIFALYQPLAENNIDCVNRILYSAKRLYFKMGIAFVLLVLAVSVIYPSLTAEVQYPHWMVSILFCLIGLNGATQLLFIGKYKVLLSATQNNRYIVLINSISTCLFSLTIIICSYFRLHILITVLLATSAYLFRALGYYYITRKKFPFFRYNIKYSVYEFHNQREVFIQQILSMVIMNSGIFILTFSKTEMTEISVFTTYNLVLNAVIMISNTVCNGVSASFGDLIVRQDKDHLRCVYREFEFLFQVFWTIIFSCVSVLYMPFMTIYSGVFEGIQYAKPTLCHLFTVLGAVWTIRIQQSIIIVAAGKFKEIQKASIIEALFTVALSVVGMYFGGMEGLILGRIIATIYRMIDFIHFNHRHILQFDSHFTYKGIFGSSCVVVGISMLLGIIQKHIIIDTYFTWIIFAVFTAFLAGLSGILVLSLIYRQESKRLLGKIRNVITKSIFRNCNK
ncbi:MAG: hypothetical protein E7656_03540 [Ruminococcaceae bacterium]|nr:hypothetical protein [Oscillospiraceae bacterium]